MKPMRKSQLMLVLCLSLVACATTPKAGVAVRPIAADNGQPKMQAALAALQQAKAEAEAADANKGGHREKALELIGQAIDAVNAGMQYAAEHPTEVGGADEAAAAEPVDEEVAGAEKQPHMANAIVALREARRQLKEAKHDKGGHRRQALELIHQALDELKEGIRFANGN